MIEVSEHFVDLRIPSDQVRIVAMQPFIRFHSETDEPFHWAEGAVPGELEAIRRTLDIAEAETTGRSISFALFPEYAVPGIAGAKLINDRILAAAWPNDSVVIGGLDGLTKTQYRELCALLDASYAPANAPNEVLDGRWVNCCVIWVKEHEGTVKRWVQPKVRPSWPEIRVSCNDMFSGRAIHMFKGRYTPSMHPCRFVPFICFDWVASVAGATVCGEFIAKLNEQGKATDTPVQVDWVMVVQHNPKPNHHTFLNSTSEFLTEVAHQFVDRSKTSIVHVNTTKSEFPAPAHRDKGAFSACIFSPAAQFDCNCLRPTVNMRPSNLRASGILNLCKDVVFREMGECIHDFEVRVPRFVTASATDRTVPLPAAAVWTVGTSTDPRLCNGPVPAAVKWLNDCLDGAKRLSTTSMRENRHVTSLGELENRCICEMRILDATSARDRVNWATCTLSSGVEVRDVRRQDDIDSWDSLEENGVELILHTVTCLGLGYELEIASATLHSTIQADGIYIQIVAIHGETYRDCLRHFVNSDLLKLCGNDPILVVALDRQNVAPTRKEFEKYYECTPDSEFSVLDFRDLLNTCLRRNGPNALRRKVDDSFPKGRRII